MEGNSVPHAGQAKSFAGALVARLRAMFAEVRFQRSPRRLKLCETLSLGDKRTLVVVEYENARFLIASTPQRVSLLKTIGILSEDGDKTRT